MRTARELASKNSPVVQESPMVAGRRSADMHELSSIDGEEYLHVLVAHDPLHDAALSRYFIANQPLKFHRHLDAPYLP
jgi:hypothetical protein